MVLFGLFALVTSVFAITRNRSGSAVAITPGSDSAARLAAAETVVVFRDVPALRDEAEGLSLRLGLTRAESLQIAQQMGGGAPSVAELARQGARSIDRDSLIAAVSRVFADSLRQALQSMETALSTLPRQRELQSMVVEPSRGTSSGATPILAPPPRGRLRLAMLALSDRTRDSSLALLGPMLLDSIAASLQGSRGAIDVLSADATRKLVGEPAPNQSAAIGFSLRANYVLSGAYFLRNDSIVVVTALTDVQNGAAMRLHAEYASRAQATTALLPSATWVLARLDTLRREARTRVNSRPSPPPPSPSDGRREPVRPEIPRPEISQPEKSRPDMPHP